MKQNNNEKILDYFKFYIGVEKINIPITKVIICCLLILCFPVNSILAIGDNRDISDTVEKPKGNHASEYHQSETDRITIAKRIQFIENYLMLNPDWKNEAWLLRAELFRSNGDKGPSDALKLYNKGVQSSADKKYAKALSCYKKSLNLDPFFPWTANNIAWEYATCPMAGIRDGDEAVKFAKMAIQQTKTPVADFLGTLAAAFAAKGDFNRAVYFCKEAQKIYPTENRKIMLSKFLANEVFIHYEDPPVKEESISSNGYGKTKWGMSKFFVRSLYPEAILSNNDLIILHDVEIAELKSEVRLHFFNDMLYRAVIHIENGKISTSNKRALEKFLVKEYGCPDTMMENNEFLWENSDTNIKYTFDKTSFTANIELANTKISNIIAERDIYRSSP